MGRTGENIMRGRAEQDESLRGKIETALAPAPLLSITISTGQ